ncbi:MAG: transketolase [Clostridiales bacterium]|nr:transketolase [Clostridiales bacterium]
MELLKEKTKKIRCNIIKMITVAGSGHPGGSLSAVDIVTYLYFHRMNVDPMNPKWEDRDRFVLSKGHCCPVLYAALAEKGFLPEEELWTLRDIGSILQGHPDMRKTPGIDMTTGSLGQGLSCAVGMALGAKLRKKEYTVYAMIGDGEMQSGQIWEAAMAAGNYHLDNLTVIIDNNRLQCDGITAQIMEVEPIAQKWNAFGWETFEINGHSFEEIHEAFRKSSLREGKPSVIIADTIKGRGVSFMEGNHAWHGLPPTEEQACAAILEIRGDVND